ncbi:MAG: CoA transferase [Actinomycetota bacterium]
MSADDATPRTPLHGITVLDLTRVLSGPHCGRMLCDLGADVIKIEPPAGDLTRFSAPRRRGMATYFVQQNVGKRNVSLDLGTPDGVAVFLDLVAAADVVLENYRPGVMERLGCGPATMLERNPRIVIASISGYGQTGPWVGRRAYAPVVEAEAGLIAMQARNGRDPTKDPSSHADVYAGMEACTGILAALLQRERTGRGQHVDISMAETMLYVNEHLHDLLWDGEADPNWIRSFRPDDYPVLTVANGERVLVSGHPAERGTFDLFVAAMGQPELLDDPRFVDVESRLAHLDDLVELLHSWAATMPDPDAMETRLAEHRLAMGRVRDPGELADTDWAVDRAAVVRVPDRSGGTVRVPNAPWTFSDAPDAGTDGEPRYRGEDNRAVLAELAGYDDVRLDALEGAGVLSSRVPD